MSLSVVFEMSETVAPGEEVRGAGSPKRMKKAGSAKTKSAKVPSSHPPYMNMIKSSISALKETKGSSRAAILKYIIQNYKVGGNLAVVSLMVYFITKCFF